MSDVLFQVWRGKVLESLHRGRFAVVADGKVLAQKGDIEAVTLLRSAAKPFQARAVVESGAAKAFRFTDEELAVICGSHHGEAAHLRAVRSILRKAGLKPKHLLCGVHPPYSAAAQRALARSGRKPTVLHNNCSGKHAGMVAAAKALRAPLESYLFPDHPHQRAILRTLARYAGARESKIVLAIDGCSAPTFGLSTRAMAAAFSRMAARDDDAMRAVVRAMTRFPSMVGHPCEELMKAVPGKIVGKVGAEGVYAAAVPDARLGIAVKFDDGASRGILPVVVALLVRFGGFSAAEQAALRALASVELRNHAGLVVGRTRAVID